MSDYSRYFETGGNSENLDWVFLVDWILLLFASISIIFHFNRYIGVILSFFLRLIVWRRYKVRVKITALKVSLLGGRVFFKNITIITQNETVTVLQGTLTWRYWLNATLRTDFELDNNGMDKERNEKLPARFILQLYGLEVFLYNRVYAYENLMDFIKKSDLESDSEFSKELQLNMDSSALSSETFKSENRMNENDTTVDKEEQTPMEVNFFSFLNALPMSVDVKKGAVVFGNKTTSSILVLSFALGDGIIDMSKAKNKLDPYKIEFKMNFTKPKVLLKPNLSYEEHKDNFKLLRKRDIKAMRHGKTEKLLHLYSKVMNLLQTGQNEPTEKETSWAGLRQYVDHDASIFQEAGAKISINHDEYAKFSEIISADQLFFCYYYDVAGTVPINPEPTIGQVDIGNGGSAPTYGLYLSISHGVLHYGPWANRERVGIQRMLFPTACRSAKPFDHLAPGNERKYAGFKIKIHVSDEITMRVPFREFSKNTKVDSGEDLDIDNNIKPPFGWIEMRLQKDSLFVSETSYIPTAEKGWDNSIRAEFVRPEVRTSTNHDILLRADEYILQAETGFPLEWNGLTNWKFHNRASNAEIFLLREHIILMTDMVSDFSYGLPTPYDLFKPFIYDIDIELSKNYKLYLNVNDNNVINNPLDFNDNVYLSFQGDALFSKVNIPLTTIVKKSTCVSYELSTDYFDLVLDAPPWHTLNNFLKSKTLGRSKSFAIEGSYTYHSIIDIGTVDTIVIDCTCEDTVLELYGFILRYMLKIKENYFGIYKIFKTLLEFTDDLNNLQDLKSLQDDSSKGTELKPAKIENEMDLLFSFSLQTGCLILPSNIYNCDSHVGLYFDNLDVDIRYTNYYMDLQCDISEIKARSSTNCASSTLIHDALTPKYTDLKEDMTIAKIQVHGHRMFGLPPLELTYFCKWDFVLGEIAIVSSPRFTTLLIASVMNLKFSLKDVENLFVPKPVILSDMVVVTFQCPSLLVDLITDNGSTLRVVLKPIEVDVNDLANDRYSLRVNLKIPTIQLKMLNKDQQVLGLVETSIYFTNFVQKKNFEEEVKLQQDHVRANDAPFHRTPFFLIKDRDVLYRKAYGSIKPSFSLPSVPLPLNAQSIDLIIESLLAESQSYQDDPNVNFDNFKMGAGDYSPDDRSAFDPLRTTKSYYEDSEYSPATAPDPDYEHDNFIVNLSNVEGFLNPDGLDIMVDVFDLFNNFTMEGLMDSLHIETIMGLRKLADDKSTIMNFRLVTPIVDLKWGHFEGFESINDLNQWDRVRPDYLEAMACNISSVISLTSKKVFTAAPRLMDRVNVTNGLISAIHVKEINLNVVKSQSHPDLNLSYSKPVDISLHELEFWSTNNDALLLGSVNLRAILLAVDGDQLEWLANFINLNKNKIEPAISQIKEIGSRKELAYRALIYHLTAGGLDYSIEHDPAVLTKPAYIMRSSKSHIRSNDSWKIAVRLRHIMQSLPRSWIKEKDELFQLQRWNTSEDQGMVVLNTFRKWRSWEFTDISDCYLFRKVFNIAKGFTENSSNKQPQKFIVALESLSFKLTSNDNDDDYVLLDYLNCSLSMDKGKKSMDYEGTESERSERFDCKKMDIVLSLDSVKDRLSPLSLRLKNFLSSFSSDKGSQSIPTSRLEEPAFAKKYFDVSAVIHRNEHIICIDKVALKCAGDGFTLSTMLVSQAGMSEELALNTVMGYDFAKSDLILSGDSFASIDSKKGSCAFSSTGRWSEGLKKVNISLSELNFKCDKGTDDYVNLVDTIVNHEAKLLKGYTSQNAINSTSKANNTTDSTPRKEFFKFPVLVSTNFDKISWDIEVVTPVKHTGQVNQFTIDAHIMKGIFISEFKAFSVITNIILNDNGFGGSTHFKSEVSKLHIFTKLILADNYNLLNILVSTNRAILTVPQLVESLTSIYKAKPDVLENIEKLRRVIKYSKISSLDSSKSEETNGKLPASNIRPLLARFSFKNNYAAFNTSVENQAYRMDTRNVTLALFNYSMSEIKEVRPVRLHGEVDLPSSRFVIGTGKDEIPVVGISFAVKVINPDNIEHMLQTLQVELRYCRVFLTPKILALLLSMQKTVLSAIENFKTPGVEKELPETDKSSSPALTYPQRSILGFFSIHVLAYNICIGWIFDDPKSENRGVTIGCERIFVVSEKKVGKLTFVDAYLSLAQGSSPSTFFGSDGEYEAPSRAFLPNMQFIYAIVFKDGQKNMHTTVTGEQLDLRFEADGAKVIDELLKSINRFKKIVKEKAIRTGQTQGRRVSALEGVSINKVEFHSIECLTSFAGAKVMIYNSDADSLQNCSSFTLESPAVKLALNYVHTPDLVKKHSLKVETIILASKNTLYATCVPVIGKLSQKVKDMMHSSTSDLEVIKAVKEDLPNPYGTLLDDIDIDFGILIEPQKISLSCEPTAKVEATASFQSLDVRVGTAAEVLWVIWKLEGLEASLQHVYSRETSGSINVEEVLMTAFYNFKQDLKLSTTVFVSEVRALINVKQLQDLDLFRDIWIPKEFQKLDHNLLELSPEIRSRRIANHIREASTATAMPWMIELLVLKTDCTIDMGKSLGVLSLKADRFWAVSKKGVSWEQNLRLAIDKIALTSEGRLGGEFLVENITLLSAIAWMANNKTYEHPLVVISAGIGSIQSKSSLDFHTFFVCNLKGLALSMFNKRGVSASSHDSLYATTDVESLEVYFTALAASNFWDIYNTMLRINRDIQVSYKEVLRDSSNKISSDMLKKKKEADDSFAEILNGLTTSLNVRIGKLLVHVYPSSLMDSQVLVFNLGEAYATFFQNTGKKIENRMKLKLTDFIVSLSTFHNKLKDENSFNLMSMENFFKKSREVKGGTIFVFPSMLINMDIWQEVGSNVIEYKYLSTFGGKVDIRWNLGSVNFIRDMWTSHANALSSRLESYRRIQTKGELALKAALEDKSLFETVNLEDRLKIVESGSKYVYIPLVPLVAEAPQLKELGDATPPLEWFGVHRTKFPNVSHQMVIVPLQKMVHEVETQYGRILK